MSTIEIDGLNEEDFRRSIENRLREGRAEAAIERLRPLLAPYAGPGGLLPERFLTVDASDLVLTGWDALFDAVRRRDMPGRKITAISLAFAWPEGDAPAPDAEGRLRPHIETSFYSDNAYPFSQSSRDDLLEGYSFYGCAWSGDCEASDTTVSVEGIDDLHGALASLEACLLASEEPEEDGVRAGSLGACMLSALFVQAVANRVAADGLPRPLCVMAGSSGVYPYFDAPVAGMPEVARKQAEAAEEEEDRIAASRGVPAPRYSSLLMAGIPRAKKRAVLVLDKDDDLADRIAQLRHLGHHEHEAAPDDQIAAAHVTPPEAPLDVWSASAEVPAPDAMPIARADSPLLVKKHAKKGQNLHEILGLVDPAPDLGTALPALPEEPHGEAQAPAEPPQWDDWADWDAPAEPPAPVEREVLTEPGFALLADDSQTWSQSLLLAKPFPAAVIAEPELPAAAEPVEALLPLWAAEPAKPEARPGPSLREKLCADAPTEPDSLATRLAAAWRSLIAAVRARIGL